MSQVITASRLRDGAVLFRAADGAWVETIDRAQCLDSTDDIKAALSASAQSEADNVVIDIYAIEVAVKDGAVVPTRLREAIRASGPTVHPEHGKPAPTRLPS